MSKVQEAYEVWAQDWKPSNGENHPVLLDVFEAGWLAAIELDMRFAREIAKYLREKYDSSNEKRKSDPC